MIADFRPADRSAYRLMMDGSLALADIEVNGMRIDVSYLERSIQKVQERIEDLTDDLKSDSIYRVWEKKFGKKTSLKSRDQLGKILFGELGIRMEFVTKTGRPKTDVASLEGYDIPFIKKWLEVESLNKLRSTFLIGIRREVVDGFLHPSFNLHLVTSYRSSSDSPNFQNLPIRDKLQGKIIRRAFIPRDGHVLVEIDYSAIEVRGAACYHCDPTMIEYIETGHDLHRDMAAECYLLEPSQVTKEIRYFGKNGFVFPSFYGDWYKSICKAMWKPVEEGIQLADGTRLKDHLREKGIEILGECDFDRDPLPGTFENHIKEVSDRFWNERFPVYSRWKDEWWYSYLEKGWFRMKTGFICQGVYKKNQVINSPVQGSSFHCLLWSLIQINRWLKKRKMRSMIVGQIHDSVVLDVYRSELDDVLHVCKRIMTEDIRKEWDWIIVPLEIEAEIAETNWFEKRPIEVL